MLHRFGILFSGLVVLANGLDSEAATPQRTVVIGHAALNARVTPLWIAEQTMPATRKIHCSRDILGAVAFG